MRSVLSVCGRYASAAGLEEIVESLDVDLDLSAEPGRGVLRAPQEPPAGAPDYNMAPTKQAPVVLTRAPRGGDGMPRRQLRLLTWGLVPSWASAPSVGTRMINLRAETLLAKPSFARIALARRALVPALGWYEWQHSPTATDSKGHPRRQPFFIRRDDGDVVAMAGVYEFWRDRAVADADDPQAWLTTFAVLTIAAEAGIDRIHDRQPLVLDRGQWAGWLDPEATDVDRIAPLLLGEAAGRFTAYPVGRAVGNSRVNGPQLLDPAPAEDLHGVVDPMTGEIIGGPQ